MNFALPSRAALLSAVLAVSGSASAATLTFDEIPSEPVDGLTIAGVSFGFEIGGSPSDDATYNVDLGLGTTLHLSDPVLEGDAAGLLFLRFVDPTTTLSFGLALLAGADIDPAAQVELFDAGGLLIDSFLFATLGDPNLGISEGWFDWSDVASPISTAVIDFEDAGGRFAIDNLSYTPIPESGTVLAGLAVGGLIAVRWVRHAGRRR